MAEWYDRHVSDERADGQHREPPSRANHRLKLASIGAALSTTLAGFVVVRAGDSAGFLVLAAVAAAGLLVFWLAMPESKPPESPASAERRGERPGEALVSAR